MTFAHNIWKVVLGFNQPPPTYHQPVRILQAIENIECPPTSPTFPTFLGNIVIRACTHTCIGVGKKVGEVGEVGGRVMKSMTCEVLEVGGFRPRLVVFAGRLV